MIAKIVGEEIHLPGLATAHSHAFQRALRGKTHGDQGSFWSWRSGMYNLAAKLSPEAVYTLSRFAYTELAQSGVTAVGEFHYLHHGPDGTPYATRTELADAVIQAATDVGIRICLLRVLYARPGFGRIAEGPQRRFCDSSFESALADVDALRARYESSATVRIGIAVHSVRAAPQPWIEAASDYARKHNMPFHMHVAEQRREVQECLAEVGKRPVQYLADLGVLGTRFTAIHATHLSEDEIRILGESESKVCVCRTTERDLGDGAPALGPLVRRGTELCFGVDSHALTDPFEEIRAALLDERTRTQSRSSAFTAREGLVAGSATGYRALGFGAEDARRDRVVLDRRHPALIGAQPATVDNDVVFGASGGCVRRSEVGGRGLVGEGQHEEYEHARARFESTVNHLLTA